MSQASPFQNAIAILRKEEEARRQKQEAEAQLTPAQIAVQRVREQFRAEQLPGGKADTSQFGMRAIGGAVTGLAQEVATAPFLGAGPIIRELTTSTDKTMTPERMMALGEASAQEFADKSSGGFMSQALYGATTSLTGKAAAIVRGTSMVAPGTGFEAFARGAQEVSSPRLDTVTTNIASAVTQGAASVGTYALAGPWATAVSTFAEGAGAQMYQYEQEYLAGGLEKQKAGDELDRFDQYRSALLSGVVTSAFETYGGKLITGTVGRAVSKMNLKIANPVWQFTKPFAGGAVIEAGEEAGTQLVSEQVIPLVTKQKRPTINESAYNAMIAGLYGAVGGIGGSAAALPGAIAGRQQQIAQLNSRLRKSNTEYAQDDFWDKVAPAKVQAMMGMNQQEREDEIEATREAALQALQARETLKQQAAMVQTERRAAEQDLAKARRKKKADLITAAETKIADLTTQLDAMQQPLAVAAADAAAAELAYDASVAFMARNAAPVTTTVDDSLRTQNATAAQAKTDADNKALTELTNLGFDVQFYEGGDPNRIGFYDPAVPNTLFVRSGSSNAARVIGVAYEEALHAIQYSDGRLWSELRQMPDESGVVESAARYFNEQANPEDIAAREALENVVNPTGVSATPGQAVTRRYGSALNVSEGTANELRDGIETLFRTGEAPGLLGSVIARMGLRGRQAATAFRIRQKMLAAKSTRQRTGLSQFGTQIVEAQTGIRSREELKAEAQRRMAATSTTTAPAAPAAPATPSTPAGPVSPARARRSDIGHKREKATGRYVGAPDWVGGDPAKLKQLRKKLRQLATEGEAGRMWYENSSKAILKIAGGDIDEAEKIVALIAIYSPNATVPANTSMALTAYFQWKAGQAINAGFSKADAKAEAVLRKNEGWSGVKTNSFYQNLMVEIDPKRLDEGVATMDMWMALAFDYGDKALDQGPKYRFSEREIQRMADELGWKAHQVQAAIWTAMKGRVDPIRPALREEELKRGIGRMVEKTDPKTGKTTEVYEIAADRRYDHFKLAHQMGMEYALNTQDIESSKYDFSNAIEERMAQMSWETTPSTATGRSLPGIHRATLAQKQEYLRAMLAATTVNGKDAIADMVGLPQEDRIEGFSAWDSVIGAGMQSMYPVALEGAKAKRTIKPAAKEVLELIASIRGFVYEQDAVPYHTPIWDDSKIRHNGVQITSSRPLTADEMQMLYDGLIKQFGTNQLAPGYRLDGVRVLNFVENLSNKDFQNGIKLVVDSLPDDFGGGMLTVGSFRSEGDYIYNDWTKDSNGEGYIQRITSRRPDLLTRVNDLRAVVERVNADFASRYGWGPVTSYRGQRTGTAVSGARGSRSAQAVFASNLRIASEYGTGIEGSSRPIRAIHFSAQPRTALKSRFYGTGMPGEERSYVRIKDRVYFYVDEGNGVVPEDMVGAHAHGVILRNVYSTSADPLGLYSAADDKYDDDRTMWNAFERSVVRAGFDGIYVKSAQDEQGVVVLLGNHTVTPDYFGMERDLRGKSRAQKRPISADWQAVDVASYARERTDTPEFKAWFKDSKVVTALGTPRVVFHGTSKDVDFKSFRVGARGAWFTTDAEDAGFYAHENDSKSTKLEWDANRGRLIGRDINTASRIFPVYLSIQNPATITDQETNEMRMAENYPAVQRRVFEKYRLAGHDGIELSFPGGSVWVAFKPTQIKSIFNRGTFDVSQTNVSYARQRDETAPPAQFLSALREAVRSAQPVTGTSQMWSQWLRSMVNKGVVKQDELFWSGIDQWINLTPRKISKADLYDFLNKQGMQITTRSLITKQNVPSNQAVDSRDLARYGPDLFPTQTLTAYPFSNYREHIMVIPQRRVDGGVTTGEQFQKQGATVDIIDWNPETKKANFNIYFNNRMDFYGDGNVDPIFESEPTELDILNRYALRLAGTQRVSPSEQFTASHHEFTTTPGQVVVHYRTTDREIDGKSYLFVEELQSDWAEKGRSHGFRTGTEKQELERVRDSYSQARRILDSALTQQFYNSIDKLKDAILKSTASQIGDIPQDDGFNRVQHFKATLRNDIFDVLTQFNNNNWYQLTRLLQDRAGRNAEYIFEQERIGGYFDLPDLKSFFTPRETDIIRRYAFTQNTYSGRFASTEKIQNRLPSGPFVKSTDQWVTLGLKQIIMQAVNEGYDGVAFINGAQSASRNDARGEAESVSYAPARTPNGDVIPNKYEIVSMVLGMPTGPAQNLSIEQISVAFGPDVVQMIQAGSGAQSAANADAKILGRPEGFTTRMVGGSQWFDYYDKIVRLNAQKLLRKIDGPEIKTVTLNGTYARDTQMAFDITNAMETKVRRGLTMFARARRGQESLAFQMGRRSGQVAGMMRGREQGIREGVTRQKAVELAKRREMRAKFAQRVQRFEDRIEQDSDKIAGLRDRMREMRELALDTSIRNRTAALDSARRKVLKAWFAGQSKGSQQGFNQAKREMVEMRRDALEIIKMLPKSMRSNYLNALTEMRTVTGISKIAQRVVQDLATADALDVVNQIGGMTKRVRKAGLRNETRDDINGLLDSARSLLVTGQKRLLPFTTTVDLRNRTAAAIDLVEQAIGMYESERQEFRDSRDARSMEFDQDAGDLATTLAGQRGLPNERLASEAPRPGLARQIISGIGNLDIYSLMQRLEGSETGVLGKIWSGLIAGKDAMTKQRRRIDSRIDAALRRAGFDGYDGYAASAAGLYGDATAETVEVQIAGEMRRITVDQMMHLAALDDETVAGLRDESDPETPASPIVFATYRYEDPMYLTKQEQAAIVAGLSPEQRTLIAELKQLLETEIQPTLFEVHFQNVGKQPDRVVNYFPRQRLGDEVAGELVDVNLQPGQVVTGMLQNAGMLQTRVASRAPLVIGGMVRTLDGHIDEALRVIHLSAPLRHAVTVLRRRGVRSNIERILGRGANDAIRKLVMNGAGMSGRPTGDIVETINSNISGAVLTMNPKTWIRQLGGAFRLMSEFPMQHWAAGMARTIALLPSDRARQIREIEDRNGYFYERHRRSQVGLFANVLGDPKAGREKWSAAIAAIGRALSTAGQDIAAGQWMRAATDVKQGTMAVGRLMRSIDSVLRGVDRQIMLVAYNAALSQLEQSGATGTALLDAAGKLAERSFRHTQNVSDPLDDTVFAANQKFNRGMARVMFPFSSDPLKAFNQMRQAFGSGDVSQVASTSGAVAANIVWSAAVNPIWTAAALGIAAAFDPGDDDEATIELLRKREGDAMIRRMAADAAGVSAGYVGLLASGIMEAMMSNPLYASDTGEPLAIRAMGDLAVAVGSGKYGSALATSLQMAGVPVITPGGQIISTIAAVRPDRDKLISQYRLMKKEGRITPEQEDRLAELLQEQRLAKLAEQAK